MTKKILFLLPAVILWQTTICERLCPYNLLPKDWVQSFQVGKEMTRILLKMYATSLSESPTKSEPDTKKVIAPRTTATITMTGSTVPSAQLMADSLTMHEKIEPCPVMVPVARQPVQIRIIRKST